MAVKLRLTRRGKKKQPFYRIVATDSRTARDGKYIEKIGYYNPLTKPAEIVLDENKAFYWLKNGAIPTLSVQNILSKKGVLLKWSLMKSGADEKTIDEEYKKWEVLQLERQKRLDALEAQVKREQEQNKAENETTLTAKEDAEDTPAEPETRDKEVDTEVVVEAQEPAASDVVNDAQVQEMAEAEATTQDLDANAEISAEPEEESASEEDTK